MSQQDRTERRRVDRRFSWFRELVLDFDGA